MPISVKLDFGNYNTYYVDEKYKNWQWCYEISSDLFPFDLDWPLRYFKGWAYNGEIIFDESGNKVKDFETAESMTFDVVFESIEELKLFDFSSGYNSFDIYGFANNDPDYLLSITTVEIPYKVIWNNTVYKIYRINPYGDELVGCNNIEKLTIPYANGIDSNGFLSMSFGLLWGTEEFDNSYEVIQYYQPRSDSPEYKEATYYIPKSLKTLKLTGDLIATHTFSNYNQLKDVEFIITSNMKTIYQNAFYGITEQLTIYYEGSISDFNKIAVDSTGNDAWNNANVYFYSEDDPGDGGSYSYYHYDNNGDIELW